eukprot:709560-Lingulodinium_polyedra.AAC.1
MKQPTQQDMQKLKHVFRYTKGTFDYAYDLAPKLTTIDDVTTDAVIYVDSDRAGCKTTRKSTSGGAIQ